MICGSIIAWERVHARYAYCAIYARKCSGRGVGAGVELEVADQRNDLATGDRGTLAGAESGVTTHRLTAFAFLAPSRSPSRVGLKGNNRRSR